MVAKPFKHLNRELVLELKKRILAEPKKFDMFDFFQASSCGTVCCFAGHVKQILRERAGLPVIDLDPLHDPAAGTYDEVLDKSRFRDWLEEVAFHLGIEGERDDGAECYWDLFDDACWPAGFSHRYVVAEQAGNHLGAAQAAADYLDWLLEETPSDAAT